MSVSKLKIRNLPREIKYELDRREKILIDFWKYLTNIENGENDQLRNLLVHLKNDLKANILKMIFFEGFILFRCQTHL